jgi:hypothetical protein
MTASQSGTGSNNARIYTLGQNRIEVPCHFNPAEFTLAKSNTWTAANVLTTQDQYRFEKEGLRKISGLRLWFDTYEKNAKVTDVTDKLRDMMKAPENGAPPHVVFQWGQYVSFTAIITSVEEQYKLFFPDGRPARSVVTIALEEVPPKVLSGSGQNPTSRAAGARRSRMVQMGDTLDWIAYSELGDPNAWRMLAEMNDLDDPRKLRPGQRLLIPSDS